MQSKETPVESPCPTVDAPPLRVLSLEKLRGGRLDELAVYDRPLSPAEIRRHYRLRSGTIP
jgi:hypothetical protein